VRELFLQGEGAAARFGDAGFFQSWAMHELRTLQTRVTAAAIRQRASPVRMTHMRANCWGQEGKGMQEGHVQVCVYVCVCVCVCVFVCVTQSYVICYRR
jgi:hypothetical protein